MRTIGWLGKVAMAVTAFAVLAAPEAGAGVAVIGGSPEQRAMARWAVGRFAATGFELPRLEIRFHDDREGCGGVLGYYEDGVVDLCRTHTDHLAARNLLHEIAHAWVEANVTGADRERFLALRGLATWNDQAVDWDHRGFEHAAEIVAWAIGDQADGILMPSIPRNEPDELVAAYASLTGAPLPTIEPGMTWDGGASTDP